MIRSNSTNLNRIKGGEVIKQGDFSSTFEYELLDYKYNKITNLDGQNATIKIANQKGKLEINATVENSKVNFKIGKNRACWYLPGRSKMWRVCVS